MNSATLPRLLVNRRYHAELAKGAGAKNRAWLSEQLAGANWLVRALKWPGLMVQKITTAEPDDKMLEVALVSLKASLGYENPLGDLLGEVYKPEDRTAAVGEEKPVGEGAATSDARP